MPTLREGEIMIVRPTSKKGCQTYERTAHSLSPPQRVHAAGVNRLDLLQRAGKYPPPAGDSDILGVEGEAQRERREKRGSQSDDHIRWWVCSRGGNRSSRAERGCWRVSHWCACDVPGWRRRLRRGTLTLLSFCLFTLIVHCSIALLPQPSPCSFQTTLHLRKLLLFLKALWCVVLTMPTRGINLYFGTDCLLCTVLDLSNGPKR